MTDEVTTAVEAEVGEASGSRFGRAYRRLVGAVYDPGYIVDPVDGVLAHLLSIRGRVWAVYAQDGHMGGKAPVGVTGAAAVSVRDGSVFLLVDVSRPRWRSVWGSDPIDVVRLDDVDAKVMDAGWWPARRPLEAVRSPVASQFLDVADDVIVSNITSSWAVVTVDSMWAAVDVADAGGSMMASGVLDEDGNLAPCAVAAMAPAHRVEEFSLELAPFDVRHTLRALMDPGDSGPARMPRLDVAELTA